MGYKIKIFGDIGLNIGWAVATYHCSAVTYLADKVL